MVYKVIFKQTPHNQYKQAQFTLEMYTAAFIIHTYTELACKLKLISIYI